MNYILEHLTCLGIIMEHGFLSVLQMKWDNYGLSKIAYTSKMLQYGHKTTNFTDLELLRN